MCMVVYAHECCSPQRPEEGIKSGAGVTGVCELPGVDTGRQPWSSAVQDVSICSYCILTY